MSASHMLSNEFKLFCFDVRIDQTVLNSINIDQNKDSNLETLKSLGHVEGLAFRLGVDLQIGLTKDQVVSQRLLFGDNVSPESPMVTYLELLINAASDPVLLILLAAATVSLILGIIIEGAEHGWIEGGAIFISVFAASNISAWNNYSKQLQFKALETVSADDERCSVLRDGRIGRIHPKDLVVGDVIVLQAGDSIPADAVLIDNQVVLSNESALTGEPDDLKKSRTKDPFLLSSCTITEGEETRSMVCGIGRHSRWGRIKEGLVTESVNTPLQEKLEDMTTLIGYVGLGSAFWTFTVLIISIWTRHGGQNVGSGIVEAIVYSLTIVVVAIPEGLPLAVTVSLAYSTKKMYKDQCFIRVLAACETMGNATSICSDKTGTLTENRMTVVEGFFANKYCSQDEFAKVQLHDRVKEIIANHCCISCSAYLVFEDPNGKEYSQPQVIGNKTEGALINMARLWGYDYEAIKQKGFDSARGDKLYSFNSAKKRSTCILFNDDGSVRLYVKGASEWVLKDCTMLLDSSGDAVPMTADNMAEIEGYINTMATNALRTLLLSHKDYPDKSCLPEDWEIVPPDNCELVCDCVVGIIDPLRSDVKEAVRIAQSAGVIVRMVTGDNIATASAIARQCGILTDGIAIEGPVFRNMTPADVDKILPKLQVMARSSPDDKFLLVTRLNGHAIPDGKAMWEEKFKGLNVTWEADRDRLMPGYREEWSANRPEGMGDVVGVTGDGTNDAPALKAADVGLAMGITGTKVAQGASDIIILDDNFGSIVKAILWGRSVYDNIRKFLQFQLTVNLVALTLVFIGACNGLGKPLSAVQMLWLNLVMNNFGALALGTEAPTVELLERKPYKRDSPLVSRPMMRNILCQGVYQLTVLLVLLFKGAQYFGIPQGEGCKTYSARGDIDGYWDAVDNQFVNDDTSSSSNDTDCSSFEIVCPTGDYRCYDKNFSGYSDFAAKCLTCEKPDWTHGTIIFNTFIWCQLFNEYVARDIFDRMNPFAKLGGNYTFFCVTVFTAGLQVLVVEKGGYFLRTSHLDLYQWLISIALGLIGLGVGVLMKVIPVKEDPNTFFDCNRVFERRHANANLPEGDSENKYIEVTALK